MLHRYRDDHYHIHANRICEHNDHYRISAKKWSGFGLTYRTGSAGPDDEHYLTTIFVLSCLWQPFLCDRKAERREIEYIH